MNPEIVLPMKAVYDMVNDPVIRHLMQYPYDRHEYLKFMEMLTVNEGTLPDYVEAGLNCKKESDILPICISVYLSDWRPE